MKTMGVIAIRNRNPVSWSALKLSRPTRVATKARPQTTDVKIAKAVSRGVIP
jgi:hypothetical protein